MSATQSKRGKKIVLADDHGFIRSAVQGWLERMGDHRVVASVGTTDDAVAAVRAHSPDILIMDIDMPGTLSFTAADTAMQISPNLRVLFLSAFTHDRFIREVLRVPNAGYVTKCEPDAAVLEAINATVKGEVYFSARIRERLAFGPDGVELANAPSTPCDGISTRELEILRLVARGLANKQIAAELGISTRTVERHVQNLLTQLGVDSRAALAAHAVREGLAT